MLKQKKAYCLEFSGLGEGEYDFEYLLNQQFLDEFAAEDNFSRPNVKVKLHLIKTERIMKLQFSFEGMAETPCDRCLREIAFPVDTREEIIVKTGERAEEEPESEDLWYVGEKDTEIDLAPYFHETLVLARPLQYFCPEETGCDPEMLRRFNEGASSGEPQEDPRWAALKNLKEKFND